MAVPVINFTTGPSTLPDIGVLSYNGCVFSPLFATDISGVCVKDNAQRTVRYMEYTITVDGYVTLPTNHPSINETTVVLRRLLTAQGGTLTYQGRGFDLITGPASSINFRDAVWGPVPELFEFQPLGAGKSAKVKWQVKVRIAPERVSQSRSEALLQFNYETVVTYGEDWFSTLSIKGTMEIPMARTPLQTTRTVTKTVDDLRHVLDLRIFTGIDDSRFRVVNRSYNVSRDKRMLEFDVVVEEKPYMDLPPDCTIARGTYSVKPAKSGMGLCLWLCTLRATYTVRADKPRRVAWLQYLAMLRLRMGEARLGHIPPVAGGDQNPGRSSLRTAVGVALGPTLDPILRAIELLKSQNRIVNNVTRALLIDFSYDEGLYLDSKTVSFSASWRIVTAFSHILLASGLWKKLPETTERGENIWAASMKSVSGAHSWLPNTLDPSLDVIVDFGGP